MNRVTQSARLIGRMGGRNGSVLFTDNARMSVHSSILCHSERYKENPHISALECADIWALSVNKTRGLIRIFRRCHPGCHLSFRRWHIISASLLWLTIFLCPILTFPPSFWPHLSKNMSQILRKMRGTFKFVYKFCTMCSLGGKRKRRGIPPVRPIRRADCVTWLYVTHKLCKWITWRNRRV